MREAFRKEHKVAFTFPERRSRIDAVVKAQADGRISTALALDAIRFLMKADDVFSVLHACVHARNVIECGLVCEDCITPAEHF